MDIGVPFDGWGFVKEVIAIVVVEVMGITVDMVDVVDVGVDIVTAAVDSL